MFSTFCVFLLSGGKSCLVCSWEKETYADTERIQLCDQHYYVLLLKSIMEVKNPVVVKLGQQFHLPESQDFSLSSRRDEFGSKIRLFCLQCHSLHIGEGPPVTEVTQEVRDRSTDICMYFKDFLSFQGK